MLTQWFTGEVHGVEREVITTFSHISPGQPTGEHHPKTNAHRYSALGVSRKSSREARYTYSK